MLLVCLKNAQYSLVSFRSRLHGIYDFIGSRMRNIHWSHYAQDCTVFMTSLAQECAIFIGLITLKIAHRLWLNLSQEFIKLPGLI